MLKGRKILFIGPKFFGYEIEITKTLISLGAKVDFYDERPKNSFLVRVFIRLNFKFLINDLIEKYYNLMFDEVKNRIEKALAAAVAQGTNGTHQLSQVVRKTIGNWVGQEHRRKPMIVPLVIEV